MKSISAGLTRRAASSVIHNWGNDALCRGTIAGSAAAASVLDAPPIWSSFQAVEKLSECARIVSATLRRQEAFWIGWSGSQSASLTWQAVRSTSTSPSSLLEAVVACESVIAPLEEQIVNSAEVQAARLTCLRLEQRIRELSGTPSLVTDHSIGLEEALALCGAALTPLEAAQRRATALGEVGPLCSSPAETVIDAAISPLGDELPRQPGLEAEPRAANTSATAERAARLLLRRRCFRALGLLLLAAMLTMTFLAINLDLPQKLHQWLSAKGLWGSSWFEPQLASSRSEGVQSWTPMRHERN
eukprot:CAMPEP_0170578022 /NCGR_PEP_ID=MMETSP0224-20130122/5238_1 /TAXON_ID=285029 /ORGANISM="Togula jolla, Strain CCCM 725" /LENGTH=301 /DNA_ID=CAMNT_0010900971 /DNA_START=28 /DNA_END=932 /DNA_ORIENTATION=-